MPETAEIASLSEKKEDQANKEVKVELIDKIEKTDLSPPLSPNKFIPQKRSNITSKVTSEVSSSNSSQSQISQIIDGERIFVRKVDP